MQAFPAADIGVRTRPPSLCRLALLLSFVAAIFMAPAFAAGQALPSGWTATNVGNPQPAGSVQTVSCTGCLSLVVRGAGLDVGGTWDQFMFAHRPLTGDGVVVARVDALEQTDPRAKAGVMMRESVSPQSRHAYLSITPTSGLVFQSRDATGGETAQIVNPSPRLPVWLRLERRGTAILASYSSNGTAWVHAGAVTLPLAQTVQVGVGVTSHYRSVLTSATVTNVDVRESQLPEGWLTTDVGAPAVQGSASFNAGTFAISGAGADVWSVTDQFRFAYRQIRGDVDIVARVSALDYADAWTKTGLMIRESLAANAAHGFMLVSSSMGVAFQRRPAAGLSSLNTSGGAGRAPVWLKLSRRGNLVTGYRSTDGVTWTPVGNHTLVLSETALVGLAVTSRKTDTLVTSLFEHVTVTSLRVNAPPAVTITSPASGSSLSAPASLTLSANAWDADGAIANVSFYAGTTLLTVANAAPYTATWTAAAGTHTLTVVARDDEGAMTSATATVQVMPPNERPTVSLTSPAAGSSVRGPSVVLAAVANDGDGYVSRVDFFVNGAYAGSDSVAPFTTGWSGAPGTYAFHAVAYDDDGASTASAVHSATVTPQPVGWDVQFTPAGDHATNVDSYTVDFVRAEAVNGPVVASRNIGKPSGPLVTVDVSDLVLPLPAGWYVARVRANNVIGSSAVVLSAAFER